MAGVISSIACTVNAAEEDREACNSWRALFRKLPRDFAHAHAHKYVQPYFLGCYTSLTTHYCYGNLGLFEAPGAAEEFRNIHAYSDADGVYYDHPKGSVARFTH